MTCQVQHRDKVGWYLFWDNGYTSAMPDEATAKRLQASDKLLEALKWLVAAEDQFVSDTGTLLDDPVSDAVTKARELLKALDTAPTQ